eukprot:TRINITY_DN53033_c0_g1_i1.p2 TRINITY_DN53033_c0_g1~~TRINITY_DN53033_c0_g1_i1.p2  ORF type:complete len:100 (-),score=8.39 TRINITY_DN53033_c0_g1_i1:161-460(-)
MKQMKQLKMQILLCSAMGNFPVKWVSGIGEECLEEFRLLPAADFSVFEVSFAGTTEVSPSPGPSLYTTDTEGAYGASGRGRSGAQTPEKVFRSLCYLVE